MGQPDSRSARPLGRNRPERQRPPPPSERTLPSFRSNAGGHAAGLSMRGGTRRPPARAAASREGKARDSPPPPIRRPGRPPSAGRACSAGDGRLNAADPSTPLTLPQGAFSRCERRRCRGCERGQRREGGKRGERWGGGGTYGRPFAGGVDDRQGRQVRRRTGGGRRRLLLGEHRRRRRRRRLCAREV